MLHKLPFIRPILIVTVEKQAILNYPFTNNSKLWTLFGSMIKVQKKKITFL